MIEAIEFDLRNRPDLDVRTQQGLMRVLGVSRDTFKRMLGATGLTGVESFQDCQIGLILECQKQIKLRRETYESFGRKLDEYFGSETTGE